MELTFITDEATQDPEQFLELAREFNLRSVELRTVWDTSVDELALDQRAELRARLQDAGIGACCVASPVFKCPVGADLDVQLDRLRRTLDAAEFFDTPLVRIFSFWRTLDRDAHLGLIADVLRRAGEIARPTGIGLAVENGRRTMHSTGAELGELLAHLDATVFSALWDPSNAMTSGLDMQPVTVGYKHIAGRVSHVHVKDPRRTPGGGFAFGDIGSGELGVAAQIEALRGDGFAGHVSLETHWRPDRRLRDAQLDTPGGVEFSRDGHAATHTSLERLRQLLSAS